MPALQVLTTAAEIDRVIAALAVADAVAFDTEFHSERTYIPRLMLMQLATRDAIFLIDPLGGVDLRPLFAAMSRPGLVVVGHALKNDLRIVWLLHEMLLNEIFDTQIAAAFLGHGLQIGLSGLLQHVCGVHQPKGDQMADWSQRPLPERLLGYAAGDVRHLLAVYDTLREQLQRGGRLSWAMQECAELTAADRYARDPDAAYQKVAGQRRFEPREAGVLFALVQERDAIALQEDIVPHFLLPDDTLLLLARQAPKKRADLEGDRRFQQRGVQRYAQRFCDAVERGLQQPFHRPAGRPPPPPELEAVTALLMLQVAEIAAEHNIASQLLVKRDTLTNALRQVHTGEQALMRACELSGWRADLLAAPLWALLTGKTQVVCERGGVGGVRLAFLPCGRL